MKSKKLIGIISVLAIVALAFAGSAAAFTVTSNNGTAPLTDGNYTTGVPTVSYWQIALDFPVATTSNDVISATNGTVSTTDEALASSFETVKTTNVRDVTNNSLNSLNKRATEGSNYATLQSVRPTNWYIVPAGVNYLYNGTIIVPSSTYANLLGNYYVPVCFTNLKLTDGDNTATLQSSGTNCYIFPACITYLYNGTPTLADDAATLRALTNLGTEGSNTATLQSSGTNCYLIPAGITYLYNSKTTLADDAATLRALTNLGTEGSNTATLQSTVTNWPPFVVPAGITFNGTVIVPSTTTDIDSSADETDGTASGSNLSTNSEFP